MSKLNKMLKTIILWLIFIFQISFLYSQNTEWVLRAGGPFSDKGISIDNDTLGNVYISGFFNNGGIFGNIIKGDTSVYPWVHHNKEIYLAKLDSTGTFQWVIWASASFDDRALGLYVSPDGYSYITGTCWGYLTVHVSGPNYSPPNQPSSAHDQSVMIKIDPTGQCDWAKVFAASNGGYCPGATWSEDDHSYDAAVDEDGFIYITGFFSGYDMQFDNITITNPNWGNTAICAPRGYVAKMDANGNFLWAHAFDGIHDQRGSRDNRLAIDNFSNIYVVGAFKNTATFGSQTLTSNGMWDASIFKMDKNGNYIWARNVGSNKDDRCDGVAVDYAGNIYVTGEYRNPMVFSGANASNGSDTLSHRKKRDVFVAKITTNGDWVWAKRARSKGIDKPYQMSVDNNMQVYIGGSAGDSLKFDGNITLSSGDTVVNAFVAQLDGSKKGDWAWAKRVSGNVTSRTGDVCEDGGDNIYAVGFFQGTYNFDGTTLTSYLDENNTYKKDIFVWKIKKDQTVNITPSNTIYIDVVPPGAGTINLTGTGTLLTNSVNVSFFPCLQSLSDSVNQTFDAIPNTGYQFDHWDWKIHNPTPSITSTNTIVETYTDDTLIVYFEPPQFDTITYIVQPPGAGTITVDGTNISSFPTTVIYNENTLDTLSASANAGYTFLNWDFTNNTPNPNTSASNITVTWISNDSCIVNFNVIPSYDITYLVNPVGAGYMAIDGINTTTFPTTINYFQGVNVDLTAFENPNFTFNQWTASSSTLNPSVNDDAVDFNVVANDTIIAHYYEVDTLWVITNPPNVATLEVGSDIITTSPYMGLYQKGTLIPIKAIPNGTNIFNQWNLNNNNLPDYNATTMFTFIKDDTLFAHFNNVLAIENLGEDISNVRIYPNVVDDEITIEINASEKSKIQIDLLDISGKNIQSLFNGKVKRNELLKEKFNIKGAKGIYFIRIQSEKSNASFKIVKL